MKYSIVDQDGLMLGDTHGPYLFPDFASACQAAWKATNRIGGRFHYRAERYETHGRMRDTIEIPAEPPENSATKMQPGTETTVTLLPNLSPNISDDNNLD